MDQDTTLRTMVISTVDNEVERFRLSAKEFKTGSRGYWGGGKLVGPDGKRYQVTCSIVEIGSKPSA